MKFSEINQWNGLKWNDWWIAGLVALWLIGWLIGCCCLLLNSEFPPPKPPSEFSNQQPINQSLQFSNFHFIPSFQIACYNNITEVWINVINENWNWSQQMNPKFNSIPTNQLRNGAEIGLIELNGFIGFSLRINQPSSQLIHHFSQPAIINST